MSQAKSGCGSWFLGFAILIGVGAYVATSTDIGKQFVRKWTRGAGKKEQTLAYWNGIKENYLTQAISASAAKSKDFQFIATSCREFARKIEALPTDGVDGDALECGESFVSVLEQAAKLFEKVQASGQNPMLVIQFLFDPKGAVGNFAGDLQEVRKMGEAFKDKALATEKLTLQTRTSLTKRYSTEFPRLIPPVVIALSPFLFSDGYYVVVVNTCSNETISATVEYRTAGGYTRTQSTGPISPGKPAELDPTNVNWPFGPGQTITVSCDGYKHTYNADDLKPK